MSQADSPSTPSRRAFITTAAALASPLTAVPVLAGVTAGPHPDAALLAAAGTFVALQRAANAPGAWSDLPDKEADAAVEWHCNEADRHLDVVIATPAATLAGLRAKALSAESELHAFRPEMFDQDQDGDRSDWLVGSLLRDVLALTAAEAARG